jgi:NTE family protein
VDGGVRSLANANLAAGSGRVVVLAPITRGFGPSVARQLAFVDAPSVVVSPDAAARKAIGRNALDPARRAPAARAGRAQAATVAASVATVWSAG